MEIFRNTEFIQSLIRMTIGALTYIYMSYGINSGYFQFPYETLNLITIIFFSFTGLTTLSIFLIPTSLLRRYISLSFDIASTTVAASLTGGINSAYVLVYLWIYIGYGTRYGKNFILTSVALTFIGYNYLIFSQDGWAILTLDAIAFLMLIIALPFYLYTLQKRLQLAYNEAAQANTAKSEFLTALTQQIRTPISGVVGMINLLNKTPLNNQQKQYIEALNQSSESLQEVIEDVADFTLIEQGQIKLRQKSINPRKIISSVAHSLAPMAYEKNMDLNCYINENFPQYVFSDTHRFRQLISNVLRDAIEQNEAKQIYLFANSGNVDKEGWIYVCIEIHIQQSSDTRHGETTSSTGQHNLSLRLSSQLARLMNGKFDVKYSSDSMPSYHLTFRWRVDNINAPLDAIKFNGKRILIFDQTRQSRVNLERYAEQLDMEYYSASQSENFLAHLIWTRKKQQPFDMVLISDSLDQPAGKNIFLMLHEHMPDAPVIHATYQQLLEKFSANEFPGVTTTLMKPVLLNNLTETLKTLLLQSSDASVVTRMPKYRVLLVDNNEVHSDILHGQLTDMGHETDIATNGESALYTLSRHHYDIILLEVDLPDISGIEIARQWRQMEHDTCIPIIAITADNSEPHYEICIQAGMNDLLTKPINDDILTDTLIRIMDTSQASNIN